MISLILTLKKLLHSLYHGLKDEVFKALLLVYISIQISAVLFFHTVEGWSWLDSMLFAVSSSATVDISSLTLQTDMAKIFTIIFLPISVGIFFSLAFEIAKILVNTPEKG